MKIVIELPIKQRVLDCGPPIGPLLAPYGININTVVSELNKLIASGLIDVNSKIPLEIDLKSRKWKIIKVKKKVSEQLKTLSKDNKINYSDLRKFVIKTYKINNSEKIKIKINELEGIIKSMHLELEN